MKPRDFKERTRIFGKPSWMTEKECGPLPVHFNGKSVISCWKMGFIERLRALIFGRIWVWVFTGRETQPPIALDSRRTVFKKEKEWSDRKLSKELAKAPKVAAEKRPKNV